MDDSTKQKINRAYSWNEKLQQELDQGVISEQEWFDKNNAFFTGHYLKSDNPRGQSGHSGNEDGYYYSHATLLSAIDRSGTLLDVGCANGYLLESLDQWLKGTLYTIECYGLDISEGLLDLAKRRLPQWEDRFYLGNGLNFHPDKRFDIVVTRELSYVPPHRQKEFFQNIYDHMLKPGGRFILGPQGEVRDCHEIEERVTDFGYPPSGYIEKANKSGDLSVVKRLYWFDKPA